MQYEFSNGQLWTPTAPLPNDRTAIFLNGSFADVDLIYSPRFRTFFIVYLTAAPSSTFYYRYLDAPVAIDPPYLGGNTNMDFVEYLTMHPWSEERVLVNASAELHGDPIFAGGLHAGYFGLSDLAQGGTKSLLSWTKPVGKDPASGATQNQIMSGEVDWM